MSSESQKANRIASEWMATFAFVAAVAVFVTSIVVPVFAESIDVWGFRTSAVFLILIAIFWRIKN